METPRNPYDWIRRFTPAPPLLYRSLRSGRPIAAVPHFGRFYKEMNSLLIWALVAIVSGIFLLFCGISTLFYWRKRARWQRCVGVIQDVKSQNDSDGILMYYPIIKGVHRSEEFQFTGEGSAREIEVGTNITVSYDPVTGRYFDYHPISFLLAIIGPIIIGIALCVVAWRIYQNT